jgi:hypothetical protein
MKCNFCNATRLIKTEEGYRCMNPQCEGSKTVMSAGVLCACGEPMDYRGLDSYGTPSYKCVSCGVTQKL